MKNVSRLGRTGTSAGKEAVKLALNKKQSVSCVLDSVVCFFSLAFKVFNGVFQSGLIKPTHTNGATKHRVGATNMQEPLCTICMSGYLSKESMEMVQAPGNVDQNNWVLLKY